MPLTTEQLEALAHAAAHALELPLAPAHLPGVIRYLGLASEMADLVNGLPLAITDESGSVFIPVSPRHAQ